MMRRAKIICTIGPASWSRTTLKRLITAGMDVARLNFSHGTHAEHAEAINAIRALADELGKPVAILQDLQGPKIRIGRLREGSATVRKGTEIVISSRRARGSESVFNTTYRRFGQDVGPGDTVLLDDGMIRLQVLRTDGTDVLCRVVEGGALRSNVGINLPGVNISSPSLTAKDRKDLRFGIEHKVDYIALSFVREARDILAAKRAITRSGGSVPVIAKLEKPEAIASLDEIIEAADGVMVARGDLGVEMSPERVPVVQKEIIARANRARIPVITATQMLESMTEHSRPTRAEASDVANAVIDGTDAVMLSAETSRGKYPVESIRMMARIVKAAETSSLDKPVFLQRDPQAGFSFPDAVSDAACHAAQGIGAKAIVAFTQSGSTARLISKYRPQMPIIAFTPHPEVMKRMSLYWGVLPMCMPPIENTDEMISAVEKALLKEGLARIGDMIVILSGAPIWKKGTTNLMKLHQID